MTMVKALSMTLEMPSLQTIALTYNLNYHFVGCIATLQNVKRLKQEASASSSKEASPSLMREAGASPSVMPSRQCKDPASSRLSHWRWCYTFC